MLHTKQEWHYNDRKRKYLKTIIIKWGCTKHYVLIHPHFFYNSAFKESSFSSISSAFRVEKAIFPSGSMR